MDEEEFDPGKYRALEDASAECRHCGRRITRLVNGYWIDANGMYCCVKGPLVPVPAAGVVHEPMPAGLRGAPS